MTTLSLPHPVLEQGRLAFGTLVEASTGAETSRPEGQPEGLPVLTDQALFEACGVRIAFTGRKGGESLPPYDGLNLGSHVEDDPEAVVRNRAVLMKALGCPDASLVVPSQVHGDRVLDVNACESVEQAVHQAAQGCDGLVVRQPGTAALLCFADCVPVIGVHPDGAFFVVHAGWRGVVSRIAAKALLQLAGGPDQAGQVNLYLGPHIRQECFETGPEVRDVFEREFGPEVLHGARNVSLERALRLQLVQEGANPQRIASVGVCTRCNADEYFSYRASGGTTGRHGAVAVAFDRRVEEATRRRQPGEVSRAEATD